MKINLNQAKIIATKIKEKEGPDFTQLSDKELLSNIKNIIMNFSELITDELLDDTFQTILNSDWDNNNYSH